MLSTVCFYTIYNTFGVLLILLKHLKIFIVINKIWDIQATHIYKVLKFGAAWLNFRRLLGLGVVGPEPYETNCGLWIWAIQIKFDWLIDWGMVLSVIVFFYQFKKKYKMHPQGALIMFLAPFDPLFSGRKTICVTMETPILGTEYPKRKPRSPLKNNSFDQSF